jgi:hypothetical protein
MRSFFTRVREARQRQVGCEPLVAGEEWRVVPMYPDYRVSNEGRLRSCRQGRVMLIANSIRERVRVYNAYGRRVDRAVEALVRLAFPKLDLHQPGTPAAGVNLPRRSISANRVPVMCASPQA